MAVFYYLIVITLLGSVGCGKSVSQRDASVAPKKSGSSNSVKISPSTPITPEANALAGKKKECLDLGYEWVNDECDKTPPEVKPVNLPPKFVSTPVLTQTIYKEAGDTIKLQGKIRDFKSSHPDFEKYTSTAPSLGQVLPTLGNDGNPVFVGIPGLAITSQGSFNQWFTDVPGVNKTTNYDLNLVKKSGTNIYRYHNDSFFPIDGQLLGNESFAHNYHFTMRLETSFTYGGGEVFTFVGDDDVWVFIDNKLVVDLGGVHVRATGAVELDKLGLQKGSDYAFVMFFAERHSVLSQFQVETSVQLRSTLPYQYDAKAVDPEGKALTYTLIGGPPALTIYPQLGNLIWPVDHLQIGSFPVVIKAADGDGGEVTQEFTIQVTETTI